MNTLRVCFVLSLFCVAAEARADVVILTNHQTGTKDCGGGGAVINGNDADLSLVDCRKVTVNGNGNRVAAGTIDSITVLGNRNRVTWSGRRPKIVNLGSGNRVSEGAGGGAAATAETDRGTSRPRSDRGSASDETAVTIGGDTVNILSGGKNVKVGPGGVTVGRAEPAEGVAVSVMASGTQKTYDCKAGTASVTGSDNDLVFQNCASVSITGNDNTIDAGITQAIHVTGAGNTITWHPRADGVKTTISDTGDGNVIKRGN